MSESSGSGMPPAVADLPPSCKLVYYVLDRKGPMSQTQLHEETTLPLRTIRYSLERLADEADLVEQTYDVDDARRHLYETTDSE